MSRLYVTRPLDAGGICIVGEVVVQPQPTWAGTYAKGLEQVIAQMQEEGHEIPEPIHRTYADPEELAVGGLTDSPGARVLTREQLEASEEGLRALAEWDRKDDSRYEGNEIARYDRDLEEQLTELAKKGRPAGGRTDPKRGP